MAFVDSIHFVGDREKAFAPAAFLNPSNSTGLKFGLLEYPLQFNRSVL